MLLAAAILLGGAGARAEGPLLIDGVQLTLPRGFARLDDASFQGSAALLPSLGGEATPRALMAAFAEPRAEGAATLVLGRVELPLALESGVREAISAAVATHFRQELDLEVTLDRPFLVSGPRSPRVEAKARTRLTSARLVRFAFYPGAGRHYILAASFPVTREQELDAAVTEAFDSFEPAFPDLGQRGAPHALAFRAAAFGALGVLVVVAARLRRRSSPG